MKAETKVVRMFLRYVCAILGTMCLFQTISSQFHLASLRGSEHSSFSATLSSSSSQSGRATAEDKR
jgi:hypothetical protein